MKLSAIIPMIAVLAPSACAPWESSRDGSEETGAVREALTERTTECGVPALDATDTGACAYGNVGTWGGAVGNGVADDTAALQSTLDCAYETKQALFPTHPTCRVDVTLPPGVYRTTVTLWVPGGVGLIGMGAAPSDTEIRKIFTDIVTPAAINFGTDGYTCERPRAIRLENFRVSMRDSDSASGLPMTYGHCVRGVRGGQDVDMLRLNLNACAQYGIALGYDGTKCREHDSAWKRVTIDAVKVISGSDGIDVKSQAAGANSHIDISRVCMRGIGWNDDGGSAAGIDLAGDRIHVSGFKFVNPTAFYENPESTSGVTEVVGIRFRTANRNVTNTTIRDFYIKRAGKGIYWDGHDNEGILIADGKATEIPNFYDSEGTALAWGDGYYVRGNSHFTSGHVCATAVGRYPLHVDPASTNVYMYMTECPTNPAAVADEACGY